MLYLSYYLNSLETKHIHQWKFYKDDDAASMGEYKLEI